MPTEEGLVIACNPPIARVRVTVCSACESCSQRGSCTTAEDSGQMELEVKNPVNAQVGDTVILSFKTSRMLWLSFFIYVFPIMAMIAGAVLGDRLAAAFHGEPSAYAAGCGFFAFFIALGIIKLKEHQVRKTGGYLPVIVGIKKKADLIRPDR